MTATDAPDPAKIIVVSLKAATPYRPCDAAKHFKKVRGHTPESELSDRRPTINELFYSHAHH